MINNNMTDLITLPNKTDEWTIYGTTWCKPCKKIKTYLKDNKIDFISHDLGDIENTKKVIENFKSLTDNNKTIPIIFHNGEYFGGCSDVINYLENKIK